MTVPRPGAGVAEARLLPRPDRAARLSSAVRLGDRGRPNAARERRLQVRQVRGRVDDLVEAETAGVPPLGIARGDRDEPHPRVVARREKAGREGIRTGARHRELHTRLGDGRLELPRVGRPQHDAIAVTFELDTETLLELRSEAHCDVGHRHLPAGMLTGTREIASPFATASSTRAILARGMSTSTPPP